MRIVTPIDRILQAGGDGVTMIFWLLAVGGCVAFVLTDVPTPLSLGSAWTGISVYWMRFRNITLAGMARRIACTRARDGDLGD